MRTLADLVPLRTAACRDAVDAVAVLAAGEPGVDRRGAAHVASCLRCQAEVVAYRRVLSTMKGMRDDLVSAPDAAVAEAVDALHSASGSEGAPVWAVRAAYVGGITAASAAGMLVWFSRRRLGLPHAS
ncbi:MAG TPA: hypothetical protein VFH58_07855 [Acidimicrobiales bacterium]|nr:hypothetical protein [Acidimicrobiales bacterium]